MPAIESSPRLALGIDIGGTGIKGAPVNLGTGALAADRVVLPTPSPSTPEAVAGVVVDLLDPFGWTDRIGVTFPGVMKSGVAYTSANMDKSWIGTDLAASVAAHIPGTVQTLNDADAAGLAEMRYGAGRDQRGVVLMLTFGTGIGSALFVDGELVPNTELGHLPLHNGDAEDWAAGSELTRDELSWPVYAERVGEYLQLLQRLFWPDLIIIGGGVSKQADKFLPLIELDTPVVAATMHNDAGIVGAAMIAPERAPLNIAAPKTGA
jgi:polyphosphate glucokinase